MLHQNEISSGASGRRDDCPLRTWPYSMYVNILLCTGIHLLAEKVGHCSHKDGYSKNGFSPCRMYTSGRDHLLWECREAVIAEFHDRLSNSSRSTRRFYAVFAGGEVKDSNQALRNLDSLGGQWRLGIPHRHFDYADRLCDGVRRHY